MFHVIAPKYFRIQSGHQITTLEHNKEGMQFNQLFTAYHSHNSISETCTRNINKKTRERSCDMHKKIFFILETFVI